MYRSAINLTSLLVRVINNLVSSSGLNLNIVHLVSIKWNNNLLGFIIPFDLRLDFMF